MIMQTIIFSRDLLNDALKEGYIDKLDQIFLNIISRGAKLAFITQRDWVPCLGLNKLTCKGSIKLLKTQNRRKANIAQLILDKTDGDPQKSLVLCTSDTDIIMSANSKVLPLALKWVKTIEKKASACPIYLEEISKLEVVFDILNREKPWYATYEYEDLNVFVLLNSGWSGNIEELKPLVEDLKGKMANNVGVYNNILKILLASSLLKTPSLREVKFVGLFPSSKVIKYEDELMKPYVDVVRYSLNIRTKNIPMFIRHTDSLRRHYVATDERLDPCHQFNTLNLDSKYSGSTINDCDVVVIDDFTTYGTSFWVAYAMLKAAGARNITFVSIGKFGRTVNKYKIDLSEYNLYGASGQDVEASWLKMDRFIYNNDSLYELSDMVKKIDN